MIDLHTHTCHSDGADTVEYLIEQANKRPLEVLSITDHNSVAAYREEAIRRFNGSMIRGVEITCMFEGEVVEVLGYGFDQGRMEEELANHVLPFREKQIREYELLCQAFSRTGLSFDKVKVVFDPEKESCRKAFLKELVKDPSNRRFFCSKESWERSKDFTRKEIYNPESLLYVDESPLYPDLKTGVEMIHRSGGIAFLAHLYIYAHCDIFRGKLGEIVRDMHLDGIECAHSAFTFTQIRDLEHFCDENRLLKSGGSDYHGVRKPDVAIGTGKGQLSVPKTYLDSWPACVLTFDP